MYSVPSRPHAIGVIVDAPRVWKQNGYDGLVGGASSRFQLIPPSADRRTWHMRVRISTVPATRVSGSDGSTSTYGDEYVRVGSRSSLVALAA